jgi:hypothetical protein
VSSDANKILFDEAGQAKTPGKIRKEIDAFAYKDAVHEIICNSKGLDRGGEIFVKCTARILSNFGMTRGGPFRGVGIKKNGSVSHKRLLLACWEHIGRGLIEIRSAIPRSGYPRDRYLVELGESELTELVAKIWYLTKQLLPFTMGETTYGLVGASKILFAVLPEIALPIDNRQWLSVFKTVDLGDVIHAMVSEIQRWESKTGKRLNEMDRSRKLTTLPSVYNVMAMAARPGKWVVARV